MFFATLGEAYTCHTSPQPMRKTQHDYEWSSLFLMTDIFPSLYIGYSQPPILHHCLFTAICGGIPRAGR